ncbi:xanthine dehydrogenase family protein molybdopterin-binding subunit [Geodermatophilus sabuli]|uniref:Xanthine dehydrogenase family protein molybdopterin-binding subunit n=1 Tax=Geodermatophilus sabuli TaxID=1564158 RepID=A0A7K3W0P7_9ACTN|nr:xanthine dehydrogenase family protein molybdopterin-binding subunit [Geodermatophilus sabuli]NEK58449.1 xanthine dehydrogenase family protein molybdopterin-binding subunit [Geodermatophilus sabuli]
MASMVGATVVRKEDPALLTGRGRYVDDIQLPGAVSMAFVRSHQAHARVTAIDTEAARQLPGVLGVWTAADLEGLPATRSIPGMERPCLASDTVRFVGEPVAVVAAQDRYLAADAAAAVVVDYEPLPVLATIEQAMAEGAAPIVPGQASNVVMDQPLTEGDAEAELAAAPHRTSLRIRNQRLAAVPIEPGGCVASWDSTGLTLYATVQAPHPVRNELAVMFGLPQHEVRVVAPDVGGGFGAKASFYPEFILTAELSRRLGRPVKFVETRSENLVSMTHGRAQLQDIDVGFDDEGRLLAMRVAIVQDCGAWPDATGAGLPTLTIFMSGGCYKVGTIAASFRSVTTNTTPVAAYRGAGRPEAAYLIERVVDVVADELGRDPVDVRRVNLIQPGEMPFATQWPGIVYDESDYPRLLDTLLEHLDYEALKREAEERRRDPQRPLLGIGFSTFVEMGGFGPSPLFEQFGYIGGWESSTVRMNPDGSVVVSVGTSPHGQGHETAFAQIASDALGGIPMERITVRHGDTQTIQEGIGTMGSRAIPVCGPAVQRSSDKVRQKLLQIAAHLLEASEDDIEQDGERFAVRGTPGAEVTVAEVALTAYKPHKLPEGMEIGLQVMDYYEPTNLSYPSGAHACVVEVDRATGQVSVLRYVAVDDCGTVINPLTARGQVEGGLAQGIAQALLEEVVYDGEGQPVTSSLIDYQVPGAPDVPGMETHHVEVRTSFNPLGAKGLGESGATAAPQAVVNAVVDALSHLGVRDLDMPLTPFRVWTAMRAAEEGRAAAASDGTGPPPEAMRPDPAAPPPPDGMPTPPADGDDTWKVTP